MPCLHLVVCLCVLLPAAGLAQQFSAELPASIPHATGGLVEAATLRYIEIRPGDGAPALPGRKYVVHYTGWLRDGTKFDSSVDRNEPLEFVQGKRQVIPGFDAGFEGMRVGGRRRLFIPYQLAYGEKGTGPIPPRAELIFDIELVSVRDSPDIPPAADILIPFDEYRDKLLALARAIPADKYGWRPGPGVRSVAEVFTHVALGLKLMLDLALEPPPDDAGLRKRIAAQQETEVQPRTRDEIVGLLTQAFEQARRAIEPLRAGDLGRDTTFFGRPETRRGVLIQLDAHLAEHLGQEIAYARVNGIVPPWTVEAGSHRSRDTVQDRNRP